MPEQFKAPGQKLVPPSRSFQDCGGENGMIIGDAVFVLKVNLNILGKSGEASRASWGLNQGLKGK